MPFTWQDSLTELGLDGEGFVRERLQNQVANVKPMPLDEVARLFPDEELSSSKSVVYFPYRLCHSAPSFNLRGRGFMPQVLERSIASARHSLIDLDHLLRDNHTHHRDEIIGHIVAARFDPENVMDRVMREVASNNKKIVMPSEPVPAIALGCLFLRHGNVPDIVREYMTDTKSWLTSMECGVKMKDSAFYYDGNIIPYTEAEEGMLRCVANNSIKPYKGKDLRILLGGVDGKVDFWGSALTTDPADEDADILAMVAGQSRELANRKTFFMPLRLEKFQTRELANTGVDTQVNEMANIGVIGTTEPAVGGTDAHVHEILSDGTILPANGHTHSIYNWSLGQGTTPTFSGRTDTHYEYAQSGTGRESTIVHMHMFSVNLRKKVKGGDTVAEVASLSTELSGDLEMKMSEALAKLDAIAARVSTGNSDNKNTDITREIASLREELAKGTTEETIKEAVAREIASLTDAGTLVTKEAHEKAVADALAAETAKHEAEKKLEAKKAERVEKVKGLGISLEYRYDEADEKDTIQAHLEAIALDENGDKEFDRSMKIWTKMAEEAKAVETEETATPKVEDEELTPAMANKGGKKTPVSTGKSAAKKPNRLLVGSDVTNDDDERETANTGASDDAARGKNRFFKNR